MKKRILSAILAVAMTISLSGCGIISDDLKVKIQNSTYEGKGASELEVFVDVYLLACKNSDADSLEKYLDPEWNYVNGKNELKEDIENSDVDCSKIEISDAKYSVTREFTVSGMDCVEINYEVDNKGVFSGYVYGTIYAHKAGPNNYWFYGAPAE